MNNFNTCILQRDIEVMVDHAIFYKLIISTDLWYIIGFIILMSGDNHVLTLAIWWTSL